MGYIAGTITDANSPSVLYALIHTELLAEGYSLVDTVVISTRTHRIYQNPSGNNSTGKDWYLDIAYTTTGSGTLGYYVMEGYNTSTNQMTNPIYTHTSTSTMSVVGNVGSRWGSTPVDLESTLQYPRAGAGVATGINSRDHDLASSAFGYWISVSTERVISMISSAPTLAIYSGVYTQSDIASSTQGSDAFPLCSVTLDGSGNATSGAAALTRFPNMTSMGTTQAYTRACNAIGGNLMSLLGWSAPVPSGSLSSGTGYIPKLAYPVPIAATSSDAYGTFWGYLKDVMVIRADASVARGDTVTLSAATWVASSYSSGNAIIFKAA